MNRSNPKILILHSALLVVIVFISFFVCYGCGGSGGEAEADTASEWKLVGEGPILGYRELLPCANWNDPTVLIEGESFTMWLSSSRCNSRKVDIYRATSINGRDWNVTLEPILTPGESGEWDSSRVETPSVVKVGSTYHLYYTGNAEGEAATAFQIGHATREEGESQWQKDPANPVLRKPAGTNEWGRLGVAEPGVTFKDGKFYLYHARIRCRNGFAAGTCSGPQPVAERGIALAISSDGSNFSLAQEQPVLLQSAAYPTSENFEGYSTPMAYVDQNGVVQLFYDVFKLFPDNSRKQVAIARAESADGRNFIEREVDILTTASAPWLAYEVRAPSVVERKGETFLWFAGNNGGPESIGSSDFRIGIGLAELGQGMAEEIVN